MTRICSPRTRAASSTSRNVVLAIEALVGLISTRDTSGLGHQLTQKPQPLCRHLLNEIIDAGHVAARSSEAGDKTKFDRVFADAKHDRDCRRLPP